MAKMTVTQVLAWATNFPSGMSILNYGWSAVRPNARIKIDSKDYQNLEDTNKNGEWTR
jgi:hypothetical protein